MMAEGLPLEMRQNGPAGRVAWGLLWRRIAREKAFGRINKMQVLIRGAGNSAVNVDFVTAVLFQKIGFVYRFPDPV